MVCPALLNVTGFAVFETVIWGSGQNKVSRLTTKIAEAVTLSASVTVKTALKIPDVAL